MIHEDLISLQSYIQNISGYQVFIGNRDIAGNSLPAIQIVLDEDETEFFVENERMLVINELIGIKVIVEKTDELTAFRVRDLVLKKINQFEKHKGNLISGTGLKEYTEANFELTIPYMIKNRIQDTSS